MGQRLAPGSDTETGQSLASQYLHIGVTEMKIYIDMLKSKKLAGLLRCQFQVKLDASLQFYLQ